MLVARQGRRRKSGRARLTSAPSASSIHSQACHCSSRFRAPQAQLPRRSYLRRPSRFFKRPPPQQSSLNRTRRRERCSTRRVPLALFSLRLVLRLRLHASVSCALLPGRDARSPIAPRVTCVLGVLARPARLSERQSARLSPPGPSRCARASCCRPALRPCVPSSKLRGLPRF